MNNASENNIIISCHQLCKSFKDGGHRIDILDHLDFSIKAGEMIAIVGASGVGKSTFLHLLGGLDKPSLGEVSVMGKNIHHLSEKAKSRLRNRYLGFIYQFHHLLPEFTALENVCMPLLIRGIAPRKAKKLGLEIIERVGLSDRSKHRLGQLSGGERQRVAIARALVTKPKCVLADEPTGNLDNVTADHVFQLMLKLNREIQTSFVVVTHNQALAAQLDRTLLLKNGKLEEY